MLLLCAFCKGGLEITTTIVVSMDDDIKLISVLSCDDDIVNYKFSHPSTNQAPTLLLTTSSICFVPLTGQT